MNIKSVQLLSTLACYVPVAFSATFSNQIINSSLTVNNGDAITSSNVENYGTLTLDGAAKSSYIAVFSGGTFNVNAGATDNNSVIHAGARQNISGLALLTEVRSGNQFVLKGGTASNTFLTGHGFQSVEGTAQNSFLTGNSQINVHDGGIAENTKLFNQSQFFITPGGVANHSHLYEDSSLLLLGGVAQDTNLFQNANINVLGGTVTNTRLYDSGKMTIYDGVAENTSLHYSSSLSLDGGTVDGIQVWGGTYFANAGETKGNHDIIKGAMYLTEKTKSDHAAIRINNEGTLHLKKDSTDHIFSVNRLNLNDGKVYFSHSPQKSMTGWNTLHVNTLSGHGNFYMQTNVSALKGDSIFISGNASGTFRLHLEDTGTSPLTDDSLVMVQMKRGDAVFSLGNDGGMVDLGTWQYTLKEVAAGTWALTSDVSPVPPNKPVPEPEAKPESSPEPERDPIMIPLPQPENSPRRITPSTAAVLNMAAVEPLVFDAELNSVRERLDGKSAVQNGTVWSTIINTRKDVVTSDGADFQQTLSGITLGFDRLSERVDSALTTGVFLNFSHSDIGFHRGGKGDVSSYSLGLYTSWQHSNGVYIDGIAKLNRFENEINGRMSSGGAAKGHYSVYGAGAHLESGLRLSEGRWGATPYLAVTGFVADNYHYSLSNGMQAKADNTTMMRAEAGLKTDYRMTLQNGMTLQPWLKASVNQEFADNNRVSVNDDGQFVNDLSGTRGVYQAGIRASFTDNVSGNLSASYSNGAGVESPWQAAVGVSVSF